MNMSPEKLLVIIGKQQVMIELLQEQNKALKDEQRSGTGLAAEGDTPYTRAKETQGEEA